MNTEASLVPPARLGALLSNRRQEIGADLATLAKQSNGELNLIELEAIEKGRQEINDDQIEMITNLYDLESGNIVPQRSRLIVDLDGQTLRAGTEQVQFTSQNFDQVLEQYLSLLYLLRDVNPGSELTLRKPDLLALEEALQRSIIDIEQNLFSLMSQPQIITRTSWLSQRKIIPAAGLLVGLTAFGSLVLLQGDDTKGSILLTPATQSQPESNSLIAKPLSFSSSNIAETTITKQSNETIIEEGKSLDRAPDPIAAPTVSNQELTNSEIGKQAEALISYDFKSILPGWEISYFGDRSGYRGMTYVSTKKIEIYINPGESPESVSEILAHELGHAIDVTYLESKQRNQWLAARNMPSTWWPGNGLSDFHVGAGDFAEAVAQILTDSKSNSRHGDFTPEQIELARQFLP